MDVNQDTVINVMREHHCLRLIHGHTHRPAIHNFEIDGQACPTLCTCRMELRMQPKYYAGAATVIKSKPYNLFSFDNLNNIKLRNVVKFISRPITSDNTVSHNFICQNKLASPAANTLCFIKTLQELLLVAAYKS